MLSNQYFCSLDLLGFVLWQVMIFSFFFLSCNLQTCRGDSSTYPDWNEFIEERGLFFLCIQRSDVIFSHMSSFGPSGLSSLRADFVLHSWAHFREINGCALHFQAVNLMTKSSLSVLQLCCPEESKMIKDDGRRSLRKTIHSKTQTFISWTFQGLVQVFFLVFVLDNV